MDYIFVGPQRTGTTWVYEQLLNHPDLCFPKGVKETMFFDKNFKNGINWYEWHFKHCKSEDLKYVEIAPSYFDHNKSPERIKNYSPDCKIIISLRDPVEKARSLFQHHYQKGRVSDSFSEAIEVMPEILSSGFYEEHIERWIQHFDDHSILFIGMNEITNNPSETLEKICSFLRIDSKKLNTLKVNEKVNSAKVPRIRLLAKVSSKMVIMLHSYRLHWIVNMFKTLGLKKIFFKQTGKKPELTEAELNYLIVKYKRHIKYVEKHYPHIKL